MNKTLNEYRNKRIMQHMNRDLTPKKEENKYYGRKYNGKLEGTKNMKEVFGVTNSNKLDTSGVSHHFAKTPSKTGITKKITDTDRPKALTPIPKTTLAKDLNITDIPKTTQAKDLNITDIPKTTRAKGLNITDIPKTTRAKGLNNTDISIDHEDIHVYIS
jgi:hypothetical protein